MSRGEQITPSSYEGIETQAPIEEDIFDPDVLQDKFKQMRAEGASQEDIDAVNNMMIELNEKAKFTPEEKKSLKEKIYDLIGNIANAKFITKNRKLAALTSLGLYVGAGAGIIAAHETFGHQQTEAAEGGESGSTPEYTTADGQRLSPSEALKFEMNLALKEILADDEQNRLTFLENIDLKQAAVKDRLDWAYNNEAINIDRGN